MMSTKELGEKLQEALDKKLVGSGVLLSKFRFLEETSRQTAAYQDPFYVPFYYHLGKFLSPQSLLEVGFRLGLLSGCFLKSCHSVERFFGFYKEPEEYYSPRLGKSNIKDVFKGDFRLGTQLPLEEKWDLVIFNEILNYDDYRIHLDQIWESINLDGYLVLEGANDSAKKAYHDFCAIVNREPLIFKTRYGTGVIQR